MNVNLDILVLQWTSLKSNLIVTKELIKGFKGMISNIGI